MMSVTPGYAPATDARREAHKLEALGRLAGGVAHDFNNLLTAVRLYCDLLLAGLGPDHALWRHAEEIRLASDRGAALIQQLLAFERKQVAEPKVLALNPVLTGIQSMLNRLIGEHINLSVRCSPKLGNVKADPFQIEQLAVNLALNARDAMPQGGSLVIRTIELHVDAKQARRRPPLRPGHYVTIEITDSGSGMDAKTRSHLFEPFFTTKANGRGHGLGLATANEIVTHLGGAIWVDSHIGKGTRVRVLLPRVQAKLAIELPRARREAAPRGSETLLLVEDDSAVRDSVSGVLRQCGYDVLTASSGKDALRVSRRRPAPIHLLLVDVVMPGMSGLELVTRIRQSRPQMRVLCISGYGKQINVGPIGVALLPKPLSAIPLAWKVRELLDAEEPGIGGAAVVLPDAQTAATASKNHNRRKTC